MIIDLHKPKQDNQFTFEVGDVLVFFNGKEYDYYMVIYDSESRTLRLLSLVTMQVCDKWKRLDDMALDLNEELNGFRLIEVIPKDEVVLRRVDND